jgi:2-desacetyl-2-hydroxyethyl bacteriochlorophyllide A dehydrogenase
MHASQQRVRKMTMKAIRLVAVGDLRLEKRPDLQAAPHEVLVEVHAAGICGTDIEVLRGTHLAYRSGLAQLPITPGHEWGGIVRAVGEMVTGFSPGDVVTGETGIGCLRCKYCLTGHHNVCPNVVETGIFGRDGAMRELHVHPAAFTHSAEGLTPEQAALVEPASVAVHACRRTQLTAGDKVAVLGCGPIGLLAVQAARVFGASYVLATSRSAPKLKLAHELGADLSVNAAKDDLRRVTQDVTQGQGFDAVLECSGSIEALEQALDMAAPLGRIVMVGGYGHQPLQRNLMHIVGKELDVYGSRGSPHAYPQTIELVRKKRILVEPIISHRFPLNKYAEAFELAERGGPGVLKILLLPQED